MFRDQKEELNRLENALLEQEETPEEVPCQEEEQEVFSPEEYDEEEYEEEYYEEDYEEEYEEEDEEPEAQGFRAYTNHHTDVNMEDYAQEVYEAKPRKGLGCLVWLFIVLTCLLCGCIFLFLKVGGFLE